MFNQQLKTIISKEIKKWLQNVLNLARLKRSNQTVGNIPLIALTIFWIVEVIFLFIPDKFERLISIIVVLQYLLVFYAAFKATPKDKGLFYPFIPYYLYTLGVLIAGFFIPINKPNFLDYMVYIAWLAYFFIEANKVLKARD